MRFFKTTLLSVILFSFLTAAKVFGFYWNASLEEIPMYLFSLDQNANSFYSFFNLLNGSINLNIDDNFGFKVRLKYLYFGVTNSSYTNQNQFYPDRLSGYYDSDFFSILAGRDLFFENNGMLIGNLVDGLKLQFNLLAMKERFYIYYTGFLPKDLNQFSADVYDYTNTGGANRLSLGLVLEKFGFLAESVSLIGLTSMDLSTNHIFYPFYLALTAKGAILPQFSYNATGSLEFGTMTNGYNIFGWAASLSLIYMILAESSVKFGLIGEISAASGDSTNTTNTFDGFHAYGIYNTGYVLNPDFSNLLVFHLGAILKLFEDHLSIKANYYYLTRFTTTDTVNGFYDGTNTQVGHEISGLVNYEFDPNFSVFVNAGYLFASQSILNKPAIHKVVIGMSVKI